MSELKPCPFCGCSEIVIKDAISYFYHPHKRTYKFVQCKKCGARTESNGTIPKAIEAWNRRAELIGGDCTIDAVPVVHGNWVLEREPDGKPYCFHCSVCDDDFHYIGVMSATNCCPNCGAKMDEERRDDG